MTRKQRNRKAWKKWQRLVSEQAASGQTISVFCRERGLGRQSFFAWRKRLSQAEAKQFVEVKLAAATAAAEPVRSNSAIEVRLRNGRTLMVEPGFDAGHVRALLAVVETEA
jgi:hypothetical protein